MEKSRVLIVDDEPLILAGIKFMIDWEKNDCEVVGTANNGRQALEAITELMPDIVIADINMPVMNGIELLRAVYETHPQITFIMLTNLEEFDLVKEALRYKATDYVTKLQLEPEVLEKSLANAVKESHRRKKLANANLIDHYMHSHRGKILRQAVLEYLIEPEIAPEYIQALKDDGILTSYGALHLLVELPRSSGDNSVEILKWQLELIEKLCKNFFQRHYMIQSDDARSIYILYNVPGEASVLLLTDFYSRLTSTSLSITGLSLYMQATESLKGVSSRGECQQQLAIMRAYSYFIGERLVIYQEMPEFNPQPIAYEDLTARLQTACNLHNTVDCMKVHEKAIHLLKTLPHKLPSAQKLCAALYDAAETALQKQEYTASANNTQFLHEIKHFQQRIDAEAWLDSFFDNLLESLYSITKQKNDTIERAKEFADAHISEKISLQEAAQHVGMSPNYFSTYFKKKTGMNFIDYANRIKIEKACQMIEQGDFRMNEIASMLGFENAYYFSKVFRRYNGISPSEYQQKHSKQFQ